MDRNKYEHSCLINFKNHIKQLHTKLKLIFFMQQGCLPNLSRETLPGSRPQQNQPAPRPRTASQRESNRDRNAQAEREQKWTRR